MKIWKKYQDVFIANWHVGFTAFGGPAVQFQTFHERFVKTLEWIDEPMYQQIFAISQALPGSASTKMLFCINTIHSGLGAGFLAFILFSLPGAIGMYGLSVGIARVGNTLPDPVYALLSGLNAATVGIIALAAVRLSERAITDKLTRFLVYLGGVMGMLYTALWYYPMIMVGAGLTTLIWDLRYLHRMLALLKRITGKRKEKEKALADLEKGSWSNDSQTSQGLWKPLPPPPPAYPAQANPATAPTPRHSHSASSQPAQPTTTPPPQQSNRNPSNPTTPSSQQAPNPPVPGDFSPITWKLGAAILLLFLLTFTLTLALHAPTRPTSLLSTLYLAGTIIFGGGPVVIPLLRQSVVLPGWVSPRDFLLGLAVIQAFPGPNFNFAIYLGSLAVVGTRTPSYVGALIAFVAMYAPGLFIVVGFMGLWRHLSGRKWFGAVLRGVNAAAVGLVWAAVYKLWQIGWLTEAVQGGSPLGGDPWLVAVTGTAFVGGAWFRMSPPVAILVGGAMGMARYGLVRLEG